MQVRHCTPLLGEKGLHLSPCTPLVTGLIKNISCLYIIIIIYWNSICIFIKLVQQEEHYKFSFRQNFILKIRKREISKLWWKSLPYHLKDCNRNFNSFSFLESAKSSSHFFRESTIKSNQFLAERNKDFSFNQSKV